MSKEIKIEKPSKEKIDKMGIKSWPVWEKDVSVFPWEYDETEVCYILEGKAKVKTEDGKEVEFGAGDLVTFPKGLKCQWNIIQKIRKHYSFE